MQDVNDMKPIIHWFLRSTEKYPKNYALSVDGVDWRYSDLMTRSGNICNTICDHRHENSRMVAIFGHRSVDTYAGVLGILWSGNGYIPLNPKFPIDRTAYMLDSSGASTVVVDAPHFEQLLTVLERTNSVETIILASDIVVDITRPKSGRYNIVQVKPTSPLTEFPSIAETSESDIAYLLFTSGSTGQPKGVGITHRNCNAYVTNIINRYSPGPQDAFSQMFDLTFDLSVHDMFVCWASGACLFVPSEKSIIAPAKFIQDNKITFWFCVPSTIVFLKKLRLLKPGAFPSIRWSFFCGEALSAEAANAWQQSATNSKIENLYGPTEATIAFTAYRLSTPLCVDDYVQRLVPIGTPFQGLALQIVDDDLAIVEPGEIGEICLGGRQLAPGYWHDAVNTEAQFVRLGEPDPDGIDRWYRTGDLGKFDPRYGFAFVGRIDSQIKILGHRVELGEIEAVLRRATNATVAIAVPWPGIGNSTSGIIGVLPGENSNTGDILSYCERRLPAYMVPTRLWFLDAFPLNANGKIDRRKVQLMLQEANAFE